MQCLLSMPGVYGHACAFFTRAFCTPRASPVSTCKPHPSHCSTQVHKLKSVPDMEAELQSRQKVGLSSMAYDDDDMPQGWFEQCVQS